MQSDSRSYCRLSRIRGDHIETDLANLIVQAGGRSELLKSAQ